MPTTRRRKRIRIGIIGAASLALGAAGIAGAMGWMVGGTTAAIREYDGRSKTSITPDATIIETPDASPDQPGLVPVATPALPANAWVPVHNAIQWGTPVVAGQPLSGLSVRNGDQDVVLIVHLAARAANGGWLPVASMTVSPEREGIIHPPPGDYSMTLVAAPVGMAFDQVAGLPHSPATLFRMDPVLNPTAIEPVRFSISKGVIKRMPSPSAKRAGSVPTRVDPATRSASTANEAPPAPPVMTITPAPSTPRDRADDDDGGVWHDPPPADPAPDEEGSGRG